jgi:hypothetical protein
MQLYRHTAKMEQILAHLLVEMNAMREKMVSNQKELKEKIKTNQAKMDAWLEEMKTWRK